ncbi:MAG: type I methionyl aminopeptidase [Patescibacteria group bacterium]
MKQVVIKTPEEIAIMAEGGKKLARVRNALAGSIKVGGNAQEIELLAEKLIKKEGAAPSFKMVPGYSFCTCVNVNDGIVHGIPKKELVFKDGDLVSVDVGIFFKGFHTDTSVTVLLGSDPEKKKFLECGRAALSAAIKKARVGSKIGDISKAMEEVLRKGGCSPIELLVGHGVGRELHEAPAVPCLVTRNPSEKIVLVLGMVLAIEAMYAQGKPDLVTDKDGWTIRSRDGKITGLFEETVAVTSRGPLVLTKK